MPGSPEDFESLRAIASQLNAALAEADSVVQAVDRFLNEHFDIGVWAISRPFDTQRGMAQDGRELVVTTHLAYGKLAGKAQLHVVAATLDKSDAGLAITQIVGEQRTPWSLCSREVKLHAFAMLPELLSTLASKAEEVANQTSRTIGTIRERLAALSRTPAAEPPPQSSLGPGPQSANTPDPAEPSPQTREAVAVSANDSLFKRPRPKPSNFAQV